MHSGVSSWSASAGDYRSEWLGVGGGRWEVGDLTQVRSAGGSLEVGLSEVGIEMLTGVNYLRRSGYLNLCACTIVQL